jgi:O-acetyl-ADP-ribose deacetylase (regulator of RNase III)
MPFGEKPDTDGKLINFDVIHRYVIAEAVEELQKSLGMTIKCDRCDEIEVAGSIHTDMFASILKADIAVVDITSLNANVFYELGVRHALRECVTVMICRKVDRLPFNIQGMRVISYDPANIHTFDAAKREIQNYIVNGLKNKKVDSPVRELLPDVKVQFPTPPLRNGNIYPYTLKEKSKKTLALVTGDIKRLTGVADVWVSSENTHMQMARFHDSSISGMVRYLGARKDKGQVTDDLIGDALKNALDWKGEIKTVHPGEVVATESGELSKKPYGVKRIFHAATVQGVPGGGYEPVPNIEDCVWNALKEADQENEKGAGGKDYLRSILFPILGAGTAKGDIKRSVTKMLGAALTYFESTESELESVYLLTHDREQLLTGLDALNALVREDRLVAPPRKKDAAS